MRFPRLRKGLPYVLVAVLLTCTGLAWWSWSDTAHRREEARFDALADQVCRTLEGRLEAVVMLLQGGAGLFVASEDVTRREWADYYEYRQVRTRFPGLTHVVFSPLVHREDLAALVRRARHEGFPDYRVWPPGDRAEYAPVLYLEPFDESAPRALGFDALSEPVRRAAMERTRDTGQAALSGKVTLVVDPGHTRESAFLVYVPVYRRGSPSVTRELRHQGLTGYVFSALRAGDFVRAVFPQPMPELDFHLYDGREPAPGALMVDWNAAIHEREPGFQPRHTARRTVVLYGHPWTLTFESTPVFEEGEDEWTSPGILVSGLIISLLTFLFVQALDRTRDRAYALARDMTSALRESQGRLVAVTESAHDAIVIIDDEGRVTYWNPAAEGLLGYTRDEALGQDVHQLLAPERYHAAVHRGFPEFLRTGEGAAVRNTLEVQALRKSGEEVPIEISIAALPAPGRYHAVAVIRDITERKRAERERVAREAAEEASRAKSSFVANMSHEIRTPLNAILGFTQVLERDPALTARQAEHVRTISRSGAHLLRLINDILDMSRIEAGRTTLHNSPFCLHDLVDDLALMFRSRAAGKGLHFLEERDESVPRYVNADEGKIRQIFINLLGNAVKFTDEGGVAIRVRAEAPPPEAELEPGTVRLVAEVEDTGPGIPEEDQARIFDPFAQGGAGVKAGGTGLGLAISHRFVEMMGGHLSVTSQVGRGTCFRFDALLGPAEQIVEAERLEPRKVIGLEPGTGPWRILVVDDIETNRALLRELLAPLGFQLQEAANGAEALEAFQHWAPHAILMDMRMPVMDGYEATRRVRLAEEGRRTPIIAVTASAFDDYRDQVMAAGVDVYLRKPFRSDELYEALSRCLGLSWVYADEEPASQRPARSARPEGTAPARLPAELAREMKQAVEEGDMARLAGLIGRLEGTDPESARSLQDLADAYEYEKLQQRLEQVEETE